MSSVTQDVRYGLRLLRKNPGFAGMAVLVLALGIGANTAVFSLINAMLLRPVPSDVPDIVGVYNRDTTRPDSYRSFSFEDYRTVRAGGEMFSDTMAFSMTMVGAGQGDNTRRSFAAVVSATYFSTLGVNLAAGRAFSDAEEQPDADVPVVVVGHQFASAAGVPPASVLGRTVRINAREYTIVGVTPEGFSGTMALISPEFWLPTGVFDRVSDDAFTEDRRTKLSDPSTRQLMIVGRLRAGVATATIGPRLEVLSATLQRMNPAENKTHALMVQKLPRLSVSTSPQTDTGSRAVSVMLMGMAALVLLISCLNLANMLLARATARRKEIALRLALGGGRLRIVRQLLTESLLIALAGGAAGLLLAMWSTRLLVSTLVPVLPLVVNFDGQPDIRVLAATMGFSILSTILAGLGPAWRVTRPDLVPDLREQQGDNGGGGRRFSVRNALVVGQIALSLALLTAAGLFMRGAVKASVADPGFAMEGVMANVSPSLAGYDDQRGTAAIRSVLQRTRAIPGVHSASLASLVPFGEFMESRLVQKPGTPKAPEGQKEEGVSAAFTIIGSDYFETLRIPLRGGRGFTAAEEDAPGGPRVAMIDEPLAKQLFGGINPIGEQVQFQRGGKASDLMEIVGVVAGIRDDIFDKAPTPHVYVPFGQNYRGGMNVHVRLAAGGPAAEAAMLHTLRDEIRAVDPGLPVVALKTLTQHRDGSIMLWAVNTGARLFTIFGGVALLLALVGVYGVKSYLVSRRTREIGIRLALGANPSDVLWLVLREGLALTIVGLSFGLVLSWAIARLLSGMLYEVSALDPMVFAAATLLLAGSSVLACYVPALRATRVLPLKALRTE
jgi:predicted permease